MKIVLLYWPLKEESIATRSELKADSLNQLDQLF